MTNSNSLVRKKIAFALLAALALTLVLGTVGVLLDGIHHRQLETMELNRLMMFATSSTPAEPTPGATC